MFTIQQAAYEVLRKANEPLKSIEIAHRIIEQKLIISNAKNPIQSISQALERNIRMNKGNSPRLEFVESYLGRQIQIAERDQRTIHTVNTVLERKEEAKEEITLSLPKDLLDKVKIYQLGTGKESVDDAITSLLRTGLFSSSDKLIEILKREMENL
jgi:flavin-binding protein dodecin